MEVSMGRIGLIATGLWLSACTTTPMFPPAVMQKLETHTFDVKAWVNQAYHPSDTTFVPHKVKLGGVILQVIRNPDDLIILVNELPLEVDATSSLTSIEQNSTPWFAITFQGAVEPRMLQTGNRVIAVGTTSRASAELFGGAPRMLPHLMAQCLHIWNDEGVKGMYSCASDNSYAGRFPADEGTFCLEEIRAGSRFSDSDGHREAGSGGS
jgi:starvation-inducible outer membrane lipoprotein